MKTGGSGAARVVKKPMAEKKAENKNFQELSQKLQTQALPDIAEVIMYTEDNEAITLKNPKTSASF